MLGGCGSRQDAAAPTTTTTAAKHVPTGRRPPAPDTKPPRPTAVQVTVVDGDTNRRIRGARVTIGRRSARSDRHGVAHVKLLRRTSLVTTAEKRGYGERAVRLAFRTHPKSTVRIYRRAVEWGGDGADPPRAQAPGPGHGGPPRPAGWA